jgi:hypothetical protein
MKRVKILMSCFLFLLIIFSSVSPVLAITGSIGNARMVLRAEKGEEIQKYILVKNVNDVPVNIELFPTGDLEDSIFIIDSEFSLSAGEEKKAYFTIKAQKEGTTETKVNVKFTPQDEGNGVGLSSTIILIVGGENSNTNSGNSEDNNTGFSFDIKNPVTGKVTGDGLGTVGIAVMVTAIVFIIFIVIAVFAYKKNKRSDGNTIRIRKGGR